MDATVFRKQIARFYDGIAADYYHLFGIHSNALDADLQALLASIGRQHFKRVLEIGCGPGVLTSRLLLISDYCVAIDVAPEMVTTAKNNFATLGRNNWSIEEADILCLPPHLRKERFEAVFFWGNGLTHIPPQQYDEFALSVSEILEPKGMLIINMRDGEEWVKLAGELDLLSRTDRGANFVHIYTPPNPKVGDMFECVIVNVECTGAHEISGRIVSPPIKAYFNDNDALCQSFAENQFKLKHEMQSSGLSTAHTAVWQKGSEK